MYLRLGVGAKEVQFYTRDLSPVVLSDKAKEQLLDELKTKVDLGEDILVVKMVWDDNTDRQQLQLVQIRPLLKKGDGILGQRWILTEDDELMVPKEAFRVFESVKVVERGRGWCTVV